jgi:hypothetical protein
VIFAYAVPPTCDVTRFVSLNRFDVISPHRLTRTTGLRHPWLRRRGGSNTVAISKPDQASHALQRREDVRAATNEERRHMMDERLPFDAPIIDTAAVVQRSVVQHGPTLRASTLDCVRGAASLGTMAAARGRVGGGSRRASPLAMASRIVLGGATGGTYKRTAPCNERRARAHEHWAMQWRVVGSRSA